MHRVLYVNPTADLYGSSRCLLNVVRSMDRTRFDAAVILPSHGPLEACLAEAGVRSFVVPGLAILRKRLLRPAALTSLVVSLLPSARQVARIAEGTNANIIHTNSTVVLSGALAARLTQRPHVWHVREITETRPILWHWFGPQILRASKRVVCISKATAAQFEPFHPGGRVCVIYDGLDVTRITPMVDPAEARVRFGLPPDGTVVGTMGYLNPRKGTDVLIESLARLKAQYAGCVRLLIAGEPFPGNEGWVGQLRRRIQALGLADDVIFAGFVDDVAQFFAAINVFAFPAREPEGFGMAVAEAMAAGVPVVATRLGGVIEIVEDGKTGRLIPAGSVEELTAALLALLRDSADRARMSAAGRAKVAEQFNLERAVGELQSLYLAL